MGKMDRELEWWKGQLAADIHQSLRIKVRMSAALILLGVIECCYEPHLHLTLILGHIEDICFFPTQYWE